MRDKVIARGSDFITQFDGAAVLMLDPVTKAWGGNLQLPHGARVAISVTKGGMTVLGSDPTVCEGGRVSSMPAVEEICAELIRRESAGSGSPVKKLLAKLKDALLRKPVRKK